MKRFAIAWLLFLGMLFGGGKAALADTYSFTSINDPSAAAGLGTIVTGINSSGQVVGSFFDVSSGTHGFVDTGGLFTTINYPSPNPGTTVANGINDSGQVVGDFKDGTGTHSFVDTGGHFLSSHQRPLVRPLFHRRQRHQ